MSENIEELKFPPCKVCSGKSSGRHFGVIACEACKSFFKRNRNREKPYRCRGDTKGGCIVRVGLGYPICPYCRHLACVRVGMSREGIHKGRTPTEIKAEMRLQAKEYLAKAKDKKQNELTGRNDGHQSDFDRDGNRAVHISKTQSTEQQNDKDLEQFHVNAMRHPSSFNDLGNPRNYEQQYNPFYTGNEPAQGEFLAMLSAERIASERDSFEETLRPLGMPFHSPAELDSQAKMLYMESLVSNLIEADACASLYDPEELVDVQARIDHYVMTRKAKEDLVGSLPPLKHDIYTEIYQSTGMDIDDYRKKVFGCIKDLQPDIDIFLDYLRRLPAFKNFSLHDRTLFARGGFAGWTALSSTATYNIEVNIWACSTDVIYTTNDFITYFGRMYSESIRNCMAILHEHNVTASEIALLKAMTVFKERREIGAIEDMATLIKVQDELQDALRYLVERERGSEQAKVLMPQLYKIFPHLDIISSSYMDGVKTWPVKFPEYSYPKILLEMVGSEEEEELLVAVSMQLKIDGDN